MVCFKTRTSDDDFKLGLTLFAYLLQPADITGQGYTYFLGDLAEVESLDSKRNG
jgi:hypothetical protein